MEGQIKRKRLDIVDFLRGFSIFTIVLMHLVQCYPLPGFLMKASSMGGAGVHVFILCSGFGLYLSSLYNPMKYGRFLKRRFTKVYIPYVLVVLISAIVFWFSLRTRCIDAFIGFCVSLQDVCSIFRMCLWRTDVVCFYHYPVLFVLSIDC